MARILGTTILGPFRRARSIGFVSEKGLRSSFFTTGERKDERKRASEAYESEGSEENEATNKIGIGS